MIEPDDAAKARARHEAAQWLARRHSGEWNETDRRALDDWLEKSALHRLEYEAMEHLWNRMGTFCPADLPELAAARAYRSPRRVWFIATAWAAGVSALVALFFGIQAWYWVQVETYCTVKGEQETIALADGSTVELNTDTELRVRISRWSRTVELTRGEAFFTVNHEAARPFEVETEKGRILDLGTRFNVYKQPGRVSVVVAEGRVAITGDGGMNVTLDPGERLIFDAMGLLSSVEKVDVEAATDWRAGRLVFKRLALGEALREAARYHNVNIHFADPGLHDLKVSGSFKTRDLDRLLASIEAALPVRVQRMGGGGVLFIERAENP